jgi:molecular chaperone HscB
MFDIKDNDSKVILLCDKCQTIQALNPNFNYFQLFGINNTFQINLLDLNKCFKSLQMQTHPDKFAKKSQVSHP